MNECMTTCVTCLCHLGNTWLATFTVTYSTWLATFTVTYSTFFATYIGDYNLRGRQFPIATIGPTAYFLGVICSQSILYNKFCEPNEFLFPHSYCLFLMHVRHCWYSRLYHKANKVATHWTKLDGCLVKKVIRFWLRKIPESLHRF